MKGQPRTRSTVYVKGGKLIKGPFMDPLKIDIGFLLWVCERGIIFFYGRCMKGSPVLFYQKRFLKGLGFGRTYGASPHKTLNSRFSSQYFEQI